MSMNRRNVLVGLGTIVAGGGIAFGSGAFSQVSAERTITTSTTGDGSAYLGLSGDGKYVSTNSDDQVEFTFDKLNKNATSEFDDILTITVNAGDLSNNDAIASSYDIYFEDVTGLGSSSALNFEDQSDNSTLVGSANFASISYDSSSSSWGSVNVRAKFNLESKDVSNVPSNVTIVADDGS